MKLYIHRDGCTTELNKYISLLQNAEMFGYKMTKDIKEADCIVFLGCICHDYKPFETNNRMILQTLVDNRKADASILIGGCLPKMKTFKDEEYFGMKLLENKIYCCDDGDWYYKLLFMLKGLAESSEHIYQARNYTVSEDKSVIFNVQSGCSGKCTYCKVHIANYPSESINFNDAINDVNRLLSKGYKTITLYGQSLSQYRNSGKSLGNLIETIALNPNLINLRLFNINPHELTEEDLEVIKYCSKIKMIAASMQSGSPRILKLMNRGNLDCIYRFVEEVRSFNPDLFIDSELIAGFPTETITDIELTKKMLEDLKLYVRLGRLHSYQAYNGIPSNNLAQLSDEEIMQHHQILTEIVTANNADVLNGYLNNWHDATIFKEKNGVALANLSFGKNVIIENCSRSTSTNMRKVLLREYDVKKDIYIA